MSCQGNDSGAKIALPGIGIIAATALSAAVA